MKEFKPGVLVMIKKSDDIFNQKYVGSFRTLVCKTKCAISFQDIWEVDPPTVSNIGRPLGWQEPKLQIIDPDDSPSEETLYAPLKKAIPVRKDTLKESEHV